MSAGHRKGRCLLKPAEHRAEKDGNGLCRHPNSAGFIPGKPMVTVCEDRQKRSRNDRAVRCKHTDRLALAHTGAHIFHDERMKRRVTDFGGGQLTFSVLTW